MTIRSLFYILACLSSSAVNTNVGFSQPYYSGYSTYFNFYLILACGRTLQEPSGQFSSPTATSSSQHCQWRISATHGEKIHLNITSLNLPQSDSCENDYLEVRDGHYALSNLIGKLIN